MCVCVWQTTAVRFNMDRRWPKKLQYSKEIAQAPPYTLGIENARKKSSRMIYSKQSIFHSNKGISVEAHKIGKKACLCAMNRAWKITRKKTNERVTMLKKKQKKWALHTKCYRITNLTQMEKSVFAACFEQSKCRARYILISLQKCRHRALHSN